MRPFSRENAVGPWTRAHLSGIRSLNPVLAIGLGATEFFFHPQYGI